MLRRVTFTIGMFDKAFLTGMLVHWGVVLGTSMMGSGLGGFWVLGPFFASLTAVGLALALIALDRDGRVRSRMQDGAGDLVAMSPYLILIGLGSSAGGLALVAKGDVAAGFWGAMFGGGLAIGESIVILSTVHLSSRDE